MNSHNAQEKALFEQGFFRTTTTKFDCDYALKTLTKLQAKFTQAIAGFLAIAGGLV